MTFNVLKTLSYIALLLLPAAYALPPAIPGGGIIERQLEKEYEAEPLELEKPLPPVEIDIPEERLEGLPGITVYIKSIEIQGNESIPEPEIQSWIADFLNKDLSLQEIYYICEQIDARYAAQGYFIARAYPPLNRSKMGT